jgi:hypothetical protein
LKWLNDIHIGHVGERPRELVSDNSFLMYCRKVQTSHVYVALSCLTHSEREKMEDVRTWSVFPENAKPVQAFKTEIMHVLVLSSGRVIATSKKLSETIPGFIVETYLEQPINCRSR